MLCGVRQGLARKETDEDSSPRKTCGQMRLRFWKPAFCYRAFRVFRRAGVVFTARGAFESVDYALAGGRRRGARVEPKHDPGSASERRLLQGFVSCTRVVTRRMREGRTTAPDSSANRQRDCRRCGRRARHRVIGSPQLISTAIGSFPDVSGVKRVRTVGVRVRSARGASAETPTRCSSTQIRI